MEAAQTDPKTVAINADTFWRMVAEAAVRLLPREVIEAKIEKAIAERIGTLTLEEARVRLRCKNDKELRNFCRAHRIPIVKLSVKKQFIRIAAIEEVLARKETVPAALSSTSITRLEDAA